MIDKDLKKQTQAQVIQEALDLLHLASERASAGGDNLPVLETPRLVLKLANLNDVREVVRFFLDNKNHLEIWEPTREKDFYTEDRWLKQIEKRTLEFFAEQSMMLFIFEKQNRDEIIGTVNFTNFRKRSSYSCCLGYSLAENAQAKGYMHEALEYSIRYVFERLRFHRIEASYQPENGRSAKVLKGLGFQVEGRAKDYLFLNGAWRDHVLTSLTNAQWKEL